MCDDRDCKVCRTCDVLADKATGYIDPIDGLDALGVVAAQLGAVVPPEVFQAWVGKLAVLRNKIVRENQSNLATSVPAGNA